MFQFVVDLNAKGAKSKPSAQRFEDFVDDVDISFDEKIGDGCAPHYHERIVGSCVPYIDYDLVQPTSEQERVEKVRLLVKSVRAVFGTDVKMLLADRSGVSVKHGAYKLSLRVYIRGVGFFSCPQACGEFMVPRFRPLLGEGVDGNAYKANQNMGCLFNTKMGDPRILEPLNSKLERMAWSDSRAGLLRRSLIQNVEGETVCLDPEGFAVVVAAETVEVSDPGIEGVVAACVKLMPGLMVRRVMEKGDSKIVEFWKCGDKCAICKRVHSGNRQYAVYVLRENVAFLKCHDEDAKSKKITIALPDLPVDVQMIEGMIDGVDYGTDTDVDVEAGVEAGVEADGPEMRLLESPHTDEDYAEYFMERYPDRYRVLGDVLYEFEDNAHTWRRMEDEVLFDYLGGRMFQRLRECLNRVFRGIRDAEVHAKMTKSLLKLRSWANRKGVVCSIKAKCAVHEDPFDLKPHLFGFKNGVYDLDKMEFRAGTTADMVSQRANYDYAEEKDDGKRAEMMRIIDQIMPVAEERDYLLTAMASGLYGKTVQNLFILTGEGGNGKDMLMSKLYRECVGHDHYNYSNPSILTERRKSDLNQGIANMHKKRVVLWSELPKNGVMIGAVIKELTGGDLINARGLYSKDTNTVIQMSGFMLVNGIPRSDVMDGGLARRLIVIIFRSLFKDAEEMMTMANVKHVYKKDGALDTNEFRDKFKLTLFHILLDYFAPFKANGHMMPRAPKSIRDASQKYMEDSDELMTWFNEFYEKTEEPNACVQIKDMYTQYKQSDLYLNMNKSEKRATNAKSMIELVEKHPTLRVSYVERHTYYIGTKRKEMRNAIVGYRVRPAEEDSDSGSDEDE